MDSVFTTQWRPSTPSGSDASYLPAASTTAQDWFLSATYLNMKWPVAMSQKSIIPLEPAETAILASGLNETDSTLPQICNGNSLFTSPVPASTRSQRPNPACASQRPS